MICGGEEAPSLSYSTLYDSACCFLLIFNLFLALSSQCIIGVIIRKLSSVASIIKDSMTRLTKIFKALFFCVCDDQILFTVCDCDILSIVLQPRLASIICRLCFNLDRKYKYNDLRWSFSRSSKNYGQGMASFFTGYAKISFC